MYVRGLCIRHNSTKPVSATTFYNMSSLPAAAPPDKDSDSQPPTMELGEEKAIPKKKQARNSIRLTKNKSPTMRVTRGNSKPKVEPIPEELLEKIKGEDDHARESDSDVPDPDSDGSDYVDEPEPKTMKVGGKTLPVPFYCGPCVGAGESQTVRRMRRPTSGK